MRMLMRTAATLTCIATGAMWEAPAVAADVYAPPQVYGAPPPAYGPPLPQVYGAPAPPVYGPPPPQVYGPPGPGYAPPPPVAYVAPAPGYLPGSEYEQPVYIEGRPYYRECWWDWGQRRCEFRLWR